MNLVGNGVELLWQVMRKNVQSVLSSCVNLEKTLNLSRPEFSHL